MKKHYFFFFALCFCHVALSNERFINPKLVYKSGWLEFNIPEWINFLDYEGGKKVQTSEGRTFYIANKDGWQSNFGRMVKVFLRNEIELNKGLLYLTGSEMSAGVFENFKDWIQGKNAICTCSNPACEAGFTTTVPDRTYRSTIKVNNEMTYSITFIIENNALTLTVVDDTAPSNSVKIIYECAVNSSS
ncbi:hypothetical protein [Endozoicomonas sp. ALD040]|uniref:hypothetical protein n=1 Tax=unclassified Endozoicomonas TaxID=2644528 RepID=UPI003BB001B7